MENIEKKTILASINKNYFKKIFIVKKLSY